jgi:hypothetical protein
MLLTVQSTTEGNTHMSTPRASIGADKVYLFTDRGEQMARHYFGDEAVDALPKFTNRSKHAGKPKGIMTFRRVLAGGWVRREQRVERRVGQIISAELRELPGWGQDSERTRVVAEWDADVASNRIHAAQQLVQELAIRAATFRDVLKATTITAWCLYRLDQQARLAAGGF